MNVRFPIPDRHDLRDMLIIVLVATGLGLVWNRTLLREVRSGAPLTSTSTSEPGEGAVPLPLGLMQVKEFFDRRDAVLVDARDRATYGQGHISGARSLPLAGLERELASFLASVPRTVTLVIYCNGFDCHDSRTVGERLIKAGYREVFVFEGGFPQWQAAGYPVQQGAP